MLHYVEFELSHTKVSGEVALCIYIYECPLNARVTGICSIIGESVTSGGDIGVLD